MVGGFVLDKKKKKLKPRYIVFFTVSLTLIAAYAVYLIIVGSTYSVPIVSLGRVDSSSIDIKMSDDGIVEVVKINEPQRFSDGANSVFIDLHSINSGKVTLTLHYQEDLSAAGDEYNVFKETPNSFINQQEKEIVLNVLPSGFIYDETNDSFNGLWMLWILVSAISVLLIVTLIIALKERVKNGDFSYLMITLCGLIIFLTLSVFLSSIFILVFDRDYLSFISLKNFVEVLFDSGNPLLIFAFLLSLSNIVLVRREGFSPRNLLGVLLGLAIIAGIVIMYILGRSSNTENNLQHYLTTVLNTAFSYIFCYFECMLIASAFCAFLSKRFKVNDPMDYIIILGCSIRPLDPPRRLAYSAAASKDRQSHII